jgi:pyruvate dehydrogenase E2 component (dihydrolipoamide acetyltransferase)
MPDFRMPSLGADMDFGRVVEWNVKVGDHVKRGEIIVEIETDKGTFDVESPHDGIVNALVVPKGDKVPVGAILAEIRADKGAPGTPSGDLTTTSASAPVLPGRSRVSPLARRIAAELGVDLTTLSGTGTGGAITRADVERAARPPAGRVPPEIPAVALASAPAETVTGTVAGTGRPMKATTDEAQAGMRRAVAAAVSRSKREIPHYYLSTDIDLLHAMAWLASENNHRPVEQRLLPAALLLKAVASALQRFPNLNGFWVDEGFRAADAIHVGVAISTKSGGLIAPAIHDTNKKDIGELMLALRDLVQRSRSGGLRGSEMTDATITVTSLGDEGVNAVFGVIYPPQVAIVGFGRISERAWAEGGMLAARPVVTATLAADHRATDGHYGGLFLAEVATLLQAPETL